MVATCPRAVPRDSRPSARLPHRRVDPAERAARLRALRRDGVNLSLTSMLFLWEYEHGEALAAESRQGT
jgi:hypothetical protein